MASKKSTPKEQNLWQKAKWQGFVNLRLNSQEKDTIKANPMKEEAGLEFLLNAATAGYKCSISYSIPEDIYTVSLTGQYQQKPNAGITMSLRHRELLVVIAALSWILREDGLSADWEERFEMAGNDDW